MKGFLRVWQKLNLDDVKKYLIVVGELSSECFSCHKVGIDLGAKICPDCGIKFKYMGFRRKIQISYLQKIKEESPQITFIDFEDFKKILSKKSAREILNI